jgi:hypothetical protein
MHFISEAWGSLLLGSLRLLPEVAPLKWKNKIKDRPIPERRTTMRIGIKIMRTEAKGRNEPSID